MVLSHPLLSQVRLFLILKALLPVSLLNWSLLRGNLQTSLKLS